MDTKATHDLVAAINDAYDMAKNGGLNTDDTLTIEGNAADAKATGDAIADTKTIAENAQTAIENEVIAREQAVAKEAHDRGNSFLLLQRDISSHEINHSNPHGVTREQLGAAPGGFGLGETVGGEFNESDLDDVYLATGWYRITSFDHAALVEMEDCASAIARVEHTYNSYEDEEFVVQTLYMDCQGYELEVRRVYGNFSTHGRTWSEWEYVNPPMYLNQEYLTTELYQGQPVYCKRINFGSLPTSSSKAVPVGVNYDKVISYEAVVYDNNGKYATVMPLFGNGVIKAYGFMQGTNFAISVTDNMSNNTAMVKLKYTK